MRGPRHQRQHSEPSKRPGALHVWLLGGFAVSSGERSLGAQEWRLRKASGIVKLLALEPEHQLHRDQVIEHLWPDLSPDAGLNNLYQALHYARRALARVVPVDVIRLDQQLLTLTAPHGCVVDVEVFEQAASGALAANDLRSMRAALALYGGELLPEDRYEEWTIVRRRSLHETYVQLLLSIAWYYDADRQEAEAIDAFRQVVAADATVEEAHRELMALYARSGRYRLALRQYQHARRVLHSELGVEPAVSTRALAARIERDERERRADNTTVADATLLPSRAPPPVSEAVTAEQSYHDGVAASERLAWEAAIDDLQLALEALQLQSERNIEFECRVLLALGDAQARAGTGRGIELGAGHVPAARKSYLHAAELATAIAHPEHLAHAAFGVAGFCPKTTQGDLPGLHLLQRALEGVAGHDSAWHARLLARLALYQRVLSSGEGRPQPGGSEEEISATSGAAVRMAERLGDPRLIAYTHISRNLSEWGIDDLERRLAAAGEVIQIAHHVSDYELLAWALHQQHEYALGLGYVSIADMALARLAWIADYLRMPYFQWLVRVQQAGLALGRGDLETAERGVAAAEETWPRTGAASWLLFALRREQGRLGELADALGFISGRLITSPFQDAHYLVFLVETGRTAEAQLLLSARPVAGYTSLSRTYDWLPTVLLLCDAMLALDDRQAVEHLYAVLEPYATRDGYSPHIRYPTGAVAGYLGRLAQRVGRWDAAEHHLRQSLALQRERGLRLRELWDQMHLAGLLVSRGRPEDAGEVRALVEPARDAATAAGMPRLAGEATSLLARL